MQSFGLKNAILQGLLNNVSVLLKPFLFFLKNLNCDETTLELHWTTLKRNLITLKRKVGNA